MALKNACKRPQNSKITTNFKNFGSITLKIKLGIMRGYSRIVLFELPPENVNGRIPRYQT
jgi:hypothetical protein